MLSRSQISRPQNWNTEHWGQVELIHTIRPEGYMRCAARLVANHGLMLAVAWERTCKWLQSIQFLRSKYFWTVETDSHQHHSTFPCPPAQRKGASTFIPHFCPLALQPWVACLKNKLFSSDFIPTAWISWSENGFGINQTFGQTARLVKT